MCRRLTETSFGVVDNWGLADSTQDEHELCGPDGAGVDGRLDAEGSGDPRDARTDEPTRHGLSRDGCDALNSLSNQVDVAKK